MIDRELDEACAEAWADPRGEDEFDPSLFPACSQTGIESTGVESDLRSERRLRFLAVYYRLNQAYRDLDRLEPGDRQRVDVLKRLERLSTARDILEDNCAPIGFIGEPRMDGLYVSEIVFTEPPIPGASAGARTLSSFSMCIRIPLPGEDEAAAEPGASRAAGLPDIADVGECGEG